MHNSVPELLTVLPRIRELRVNPKVSGRFSHSLHGKCIKSFILRGMWTCRAARTKCHLLHPLLQVLLVLNLDTALIEQPVLGLQH